MATSLPALTVLREEAEAALDARIEKGRELLASVSAISSKPELDASRSSYYKWNDYNEALLLRLFTTDAPQKSYSEWLGGAFGPSSLVEDIQDHGKDIEQRVRRLESLRERLPLLDEPAASATQDSRTGTSAPESRRVFIVHGHDEALKEKAASLVRQLGYQPIILHEQASRGRTIIEKFEDESEGAAFALVLLTPDDLGGSATPIRKAIDDWDAEELSKLAKPRARQNVVFEMGYFVGRLGRSRVVALLSSAEIKKPSDLDGVIYVTVDALDAWRYEVVKEMRAAGLSGEPADGPARTAPPGPAA